jgi:hypothetical protein
MMFRSIGFGIALLVLASTTAYAQNFSFTGAPESRPRTPIFHAASFLPAPAPAPPPRQNWVSRHPVLLGTAIGAGTGVVWQTAGCRGASCKPGTAALVGAGVGAYTGLVISAIQKAHQKEPVGRGTKIGLIGGAVGGAFAIFLACYGAGGCGGVS